MDDKTDSQIVDENKDFLDDRIVEPKESKGKETAPSIAKRVDHIRLSELPEELLRKMLEDIEVEQKRLSKQASEIEKSLHKELLRGNASILDEKKKNIRLIEREFEGFDDDRQNIYDALQNKVVIEGMVKVLGGKKRLYASEGLIFLLIVLVLGLMTYEFLYLDPELDRFFKRILPSFSGSGIHSNIDSQSGRAPWQWMVWATCNPPYLVGFM